MRTVAALLLFIPGVIGALGIKLMRDSIFAEFYPVFFNKGIQFTVGLIFFVLGITFIGGFVIHRDRKKQKEKLKNKK